MTETFGERLKKLRAARKLKPGQLAAMVGVTEGAIRQMESGQTKAASFVVGLRLAKALGTSAWFLATGREEIAHPEHAAADAEKGSRSTRTLAEMDRDIVLLAQEVARLAKAIDRRRNPAARARPRG